MLAPCAETAPARIRPALTEDDKDRIHALLLGRCEYDPATDCWVYTGSWGTNGEGAMKVARRWVTVHRVSAWIYLGGFDLWDRSVKVKHLCSCSACFNPDHLLIKRSFAPAAGSEAARFPLFAFFDREAA